MTERSARVAVRADGRLRLAVVADTHSAPHPATTRHLRSLSPDAILHAGDIGDLAVLEPLLAIAPLFVVDGPRLRADAARLARSHDASLVVCGHSHVPLVARHGDVAVFNPGSAGPRRFLLPIVFGTIDVTPDAVHLAHFDCETGQPWKPS